MAANIDMSLVWEQEICIYPVPIIQSTVHLRSLPGNVWALMDPFWHFLSEQCRGIFRFAAFRMQTRPYQEASSLVIRLRNRTCVTDWKSILRNECSIVITITAFADDQSIRNAQPTPTTTQMHSDQYPNTSAHKQATSDQQQCRSPPSLLPSPSWRPWLQQQPPQPGMRPAKSRTDSLASNSLEEKTQTRTHKDLTMSR